MIFSGGGFSDDVASEYASTNNVALETKCSLSHFIGHGVTIRVVN